MNDVTVRLELPRELLSTLGVSEADLPARIRRMIVLELVREGRISSGKAAELAGVPKAEFLHVMGEEGIPYFTETPEELAAQVQTARSLLNGEPSWSPFRIPDP